MYDDDEEEVVGSTAKMGLKKFPRSQNKPCKH